MSEQKDEKPEDLTAVDFVMMIVILLLGMAVGAGSLRMWQERPEDPKLFDEATRGVVEFEMARVANNLNTECRMSKYARREIMNDGRFIVGDQLYFSCDLGIQVEEPLPAFGPDGERIQ